MCSSAIAGQVVGVDRAQRSSAQSAPRTASSALGEVVGVRRLVLDVLPAVGVLEPELHGVQPLPLQPEPLGEGRVGAVGQVAHARVLERGHVHPDLVGPAGLEVHLQQRREPVRLERRVVRDAGPAVGHDRELVVRLGVPADRGVDRALERVGVALHQRVVDLVDVRSRNAFLSTE